MGKFAGHQFNKQEEKACWLY